MTGCRSDRRASRRIVLAATLLRLGYEVVWIAFLTGVPVALLDMIEGERIQTPVGANKQPGSGYRRLADLAAQLFALACVGACVVAVAERAAALSVAAAAVAGAIAYRRSRARAAVSIRLRAWDEPVDPHGVGRD